jgi:hypothetical protein
MSAPVPGENPALDAESLAPTLIGISVAFIVLSMSIVVLRLVTRYAVVNSLGLDDLTIAIAVVRALVWCSGTP